MPTRAKCALGLVGGCAALLALLWYAAFHVGFFERADREVFASFYNLTSPYHRHRVHETATLVVSLCDPSHYVYLVVLPVAVALGRRRARDVFAVLVLVVGAGATTLVLKHVVPQTNAGSLQGIASVVPYPRFPSGHSTAAMALVLALTFVTPARLRPVVAGLGAVFAAAVGYSLLAIGSHFPSDVFAGFLVAATWSVLALSVLRALERLRGASPGPRPPITIGEALTPTVVALLAILGLAAIVVLTDPHSIVSYMRAHNELILGTVGIAALSTAVSTGVVLSVQREVTH
ncbi:MAG TPA: phosphatase PAP2 family protein [Solirubrobacteraceae bacterium]|nr:phosphatase PAP2 family protein [Solirubrobacteraceae bacterium]